MKRFARRRSLAVGVPVAVLTMAVIYVFSNVDQSCACSQASETQIIQSAMYAMMAENNITIVVPNDNTNSSRGVNTWAGLPKGTGAVSLDKYLKKATTKFYYCWDEKGNVWAQNKIDGVKAQTDDSIKEGPCKKSPPD